MTSGRPGRQGPHLAFLISIIALACASPESIRAQTATSGYVPVAGARLYYEARGDGPAIVLIHGGFMDRRMWDPQMEDLAQRFKVIRYDQRGAGKTEIDAATPYSPAADLLALLDTLAVARAVIVGLSAGGFVAFDFTLTHPERVAGLVAAETLPPGFPLNPDAMRSMMTVLTTLTAQGRDSAVSLFLQQPIFAGVQRRPEVLGQVRALLDANLRMPVPAQYSSPPAATRLAAIQPPVLVILGDQPAPEAEQAAKQMLREVPRVRLVRIRQAGHLLNLEQPAAFNRAVAEFASEVGGAR